MVFVDFCRKMDKKTKVFLVFYFSDSYGHATKIKKILTNAQITIVRLIDRIG
jgi:hypothetical protein